MSDWSLDLLDWSILLAEKQSKLEKQQKSMFPDIHFMLVSILWEMNKRWENIWNYLLVDNLVSDYKFFIRLQINQFV